MNWNSLPKFHSKKIINHIILNSVVVSLSIVHSRTPNKTIWKMNKHLSLKSWAHTHAPYQVTKIEKKRTQIIFLFYRFGCTLSYTNNNNNISSQMKEEEEKEKKRHTNTHYTAPYSFNSSHSRCLSTEYNTGIALNMYQHTCNTFLYHMR